MESPTSRINMMDGGTLASSPLVRSLVSGAMILIFIELLLLFMLIASTIGAEQAAAHEYMLLKASEICSDLAHLARSHRRATDDWVDLGGNKKHLDAHKRTYRKIEEALNSLRVEWQSAGLRASDLREFTEGFQEFLSATKATVEGGTPEMIRFRHHNLVIPKTKDLYPRSRHLMQRIRDFIDKDEARNAAQNQSPFPLMLLACGVNILLCVLASLWVDRKIAQPIRSLSAECREIASGTVISAPVQSANDVDYLRQAFHEMSSKIIRNEQGRKAYLVLLKDMQTQSLERAKSGMTSLSGSQAISEAGQKKLKQVSWNLGAMIQLLESMSEGLSFSELQKIQVKHSLSNSRLLAVFAESSVEALLQRKNLKLNLQCDDIELEVDEHLIGRVIINFLSNAIKFSPRGAIVVLRLLQQEDAMRCEVRDVGAGISAEDQSRLFAKFSQLESNVKRSGTGLGLMICKQIVQAHGGEIGCTSELGVGSCFWFMVPMRALKVEEFEASQARSSTAGSGFRGSISNAFGWLLAFFICTQVLASVALGIKFNEAEAKAADYAREKQLLVKSEDLLPLFLDYRRLFQISLSTHDFKKFISVYSRLDNLMGLAHNLVVSSAKNTELNKSFREIEQRLLFMKDEAKRVLSVYPNIDLDYISDATKRCEKVAMEVEGLLFTALARADEGVDRTYELGSNVRTEIILIVSLCAIANIGLIATLTLNAAGLLAKIRSLVEKARSFAAGGLPTVDLKENDELKLLDESLCYVACLIREAEARRQELMAVINHDLRTPLSSVLSAIELCSQGVYGDLPSKDEEELKLIESDLRSLLSQLNNFLTLETVEHGALVLDCAEIDLEDFIDDLASEYNKRWKSHGVNVRSEYVGDNLLINGEVELLRMAITALLDNACAASTGSGSEVILHCEGQQGKIVLKVIDTGGGIPAELQSTIFDRFRFQDERPLAGLGLPLASRLFALHAAQLSLERSSAEGTIFRCEFDVPGAAGV